MRLLTICPEALNLLPKILIQSKFISSNSFLPQKCQFYVVFFFVCVCKTLKKNHNGILSLQHFKNLLNEKDDYGCTPLHYASKEGYLVALDDLIELGATVNPKNKDKQSPLHFAAR